MKDTMLIINPTLMRLSFDGVLEPIDYFGDQEVRRHIEIRYAQRILDKDAPYRVDRIREFPFKARICSEDIDFSGNKQLKSLFKDS